MPIESVNDFVVRFANVNGSGSASANELFARSVMRMGVPVSPRNIFPSNIQGLPTWYEVRVTEAGHLGARGGVDLMVAMNPQTFDKDVASIEKGGYLFYDSTKPLPASRFRDDITVIGVPLTAICNREYIDPRQRQLFKNIIYVGALAALLDMDIGAIEKLIAEQFRSKDTLIEPNVHALHLGRDYVTDEPRVPDRAAAEEGERGRRPHLHRGQQRGGARRGLWRRDGVRLVSDHALLLARRGVPAPLLALPHRSENQDEQVRHHPGRGRALLDRHGDRRGVERRARVHGDLRSRHLADAGVSRPRLLRRNPGRASIDVQRAGPSTGMPTRTQQCDIMSCAYASHGDTKHVLLFPEDPAEAFEMTAQAFDLADRLQTPIFVHDSISTSA